MDIQAEKLEIMKLLLDAEDPEILSEVKAIFEQKSYDFYDDLPSHVKESIDRGLNDVADGHIYDHDFVMKDIETRYGVKD
jgi:predicted transcriptional regulator